jgi:hypothetical protein
VEPSRGGATATPITLLPHHHPRIRRTMMATKRTTQRSSSGKKLYAVRDADGKFKDMQTYKRAQSADMRKKSKKEIKAKAK